jgi:hypothetical protein
MEFVGFDTFMDHSCNPTSYQKYSSKDEYTVYAAKKINKGDKITCDYLSGLTNDFT